MRTILAWIARLAAALAAILMVACIAIFWSSEARLKRGYAVRAEPLSVSDEAVTVERGRHVATIRGCRDCHGDNLAGRVFIDDPMIGRIVASNLTRGSGGVGASYGDED